LNSSKITSLTLSEISNLIRKGELSPIEVTSAYLERVDKLNSRLNAYITVLKDESLRAAEEAERMVKRKEKLGPLCGIPIAIKDILDMKGVPTTRGSKVFAKSVPNFDSTVVERLKNAGAVILGKLNMHEMAYGLTNENPHYGTVKNPWDVERISGGSSGGSAAAVAADLCTASLGTDTGGSIRIPASLCGVVGLKPTYGRVSRFGCGTLSWSLDHVSTMTKSVGDADLMLKVIAGYDPKDPTSVKYQVPNCEDALAEEVKGMRVGVPRSFFFDEVDGEVESAVNKALELVRELGASMKEVEIPHAKYGRSVAMVIMACEATSYYEGALLTHARDFGHDIMTRLMLGKLFHGVDYLKAQRLRTLFIKWLENSMRDIDVLVTPTTPIVATRIGENMVGMGERTVDVRDQLARFTSIWNLTGTPAFSIPCGFTSTGLPIGVQIVSRPFHEEIALRLAYAYESNTAWHKRKPSLQ